MMITVYLLPLETIDGTERLAGIEFIHDALLECAIEPYFRQLIQDTTDTEHAGLVAVCISFSEATQDELDRYHANVLPYVPNPDILRAQELLATSPAAITMPAMWELMRIFGKLLGIPD